LAIEDVTEREHYKRNLEEIVEKRTAELILARKEAEESKDLAETTPTYPLRVRKKTARPSNPCKKKRGLPWCRIQKTKTSSGSFLLTPTRHHPGQRQW
jgi:hypothetical protein